jgi:invasion protein IalB
MVTLITRHQRLASLVLAVSLAITASLLSPLALAENSNTVSNTTNNTISQYGDWRTVCKTQCVMSQGLQNPDNPNIIYSSQISLLSQPQEPVMQLNLPLGIYLPPGVEIGVGTLQQQAPVTVCLPEGCKVVVVLTTAMQQAMQSNAAFSVKLFVSEQTPREIKFSLRGFSEALASLTVKNGDQ